LFICADALDRATLHYMAARKWFVQSGEWPPNQAADLLVPPIQTIVVQSNGT